MSEKKTISAAESKKVEKPKVEKSKVEYFRTDKLSGLKFRMSTGPEPFNVKYVGFTVKDRNVAGYSEPQGWLATDDAKVIEKCKASPYVTQVDKAQYDKAFKG